MKKEEVEQNTIFLCMRGSQAYGTNTAESDIDYGGVCLPSLNVILNTEQFACMDHWVDENGEKVDKSIYNLDKFLQMATDNNPNVLDFLFTPERCIIHTSEAWELIKANRDIFISKKCKTSFKGYAIAQLRRIETHRSYLLNPPTKPLRQDFGLPDETIFPHTQYEVIAKIASEWVEEDLREAFYDKMSGFMDHEGVLLFKEFITIENHKYAIEDFKRRQKEWLHVLSSVKSHFLKDDYVDMAQRELKFLTAQKNYKSYSDWEKNRNPKRKLLEQKCGFDSKHGSHLIRLLRMCCEILDGKGILVDRTDIDAKELLSIRNGEVTFEQLLEMAEALNKKADELFLTCSLPNEPDRNKIKELQTQLLVKHLKTLI